MQHKFVIWSLYLCVSGWHLKSCSNYMVMILSEYLKKAVFLSRPSLSFLKWFLIYFALSEQTSGHLESQHLNLLMVMHLSPSTRQ